MSHMVQIHNMLQAHHLLVSFYCELLSRYKQSIDGRSYERGEWHRLEARVSLELRRGDP